MDSAACPTCCSKCRLDRVSISPPQYCADQNSPKTTDPYALSNLFPAGTIPISLNSVDIPCEHGHASDSWHSYFTHHIFHDAMSVEDEGFLRKLDFLVKHRFLAITYRFEAHCSTLFLRIYIIPFDLPNVQGKLRIRDETLVLHPARRYLMVALSRAVRNACCWFGTGSTEHPTGFLDVRIDNRTMAQIYGDLKSPHNSYNLDEATDGLVRSIMAQGTLNRMHASLYPYQKRAVSAMLVKELCPVLQDDPLYVPIKSMEGRELYWKPSNMEFLMERPKVSQSRGGVLCEELGTGKTVMVLALILSDLDRLPAPEESVLDDRPVMTPLAFRKFPFSPFARARKAFKIPNHTNPPGYFPSMREYLVHYIRANPDGLAIRDHEDDLTSCGLWESIVLNTPFYHHYNVEPLELFRSSRKAATTAPRQVYLATTTLIVVPPNLLAQWDREIQKHCDTTLRVLIVRPQMQLPQAQALVNSYDVVVMTHLRMFISVKISSYYLTHSPGFSAEYTKSNLDQLHSFKACNCRYEKATLVPACTCDMGEDVSPLLRIRWKRLVLDEGHNAGTNTSNLVPFAKLLSVERRLIVTGTPTSNLLGLSFGSNSAETTTTRIGRNLDDLDSDYENDPNITDSEDETVSRRWTRQDREDLRKLGTMIIDFLGVPQFAADRKTFDNVIDPLMDPSGPRPGAIAVLMNVMQSVMIRHRIADIERDVTLPPVSQETVLLDLDPYSLISYNALQAVITVNAVDSERVGVDYLFHPKNAARLGQVMENLSQTLFWKTDENMFNIHELIAKGHLYLETAKKRGASTADIGLLQQALKHARLAATDLVWQAMQSHEDVLYRVEGVPDVVFTHWTRVHGPSQFSTDLSLASTDQFMHPDRLLKLREFVSKRPLCKLEVVVEMGDSIARQDEIQRISHVCNKLTRKRNRREEDYRHAKYAVPDLGTSPSKNEGARNASSKDRIIELQRQLKDLQESARHQEAHTTPMQDAASVPTPTENFILPTDSNTLTVTAPNLGGSPLSGSAMANARVGNSTSSKLNYIFREVLKFGAKEKFLIFSSSPLTLAHIGEGLDILKIKHLQFTTAIQQRAREQTVTTFETSETFRVFLMELKHGARGLNLVSASRVIFCEPVWHADVESQAIKRAHRIGQKRPINVKTLVIRGSAEEVMLSRREALKGQALKLPNMMEEVEMRDFIQNPKFLEASSASSTLEIPLFSGGPAYLASHPETTRFADVSDVSIVEQCNNSDYRFFASKSHVSFARPLSTGLELNEAGAGPIPPVLSGPHARVHFNDHKTPRHSPDPSPPKRRRVILRLPQAPGVD